MSRPIFDLSEPTTRADPNPVYDAMRKKEPVHWSEKYQGWFLTRYDDVLNAFRDMEHLSNDRVSLLAEHQLQGLDTEIVKDYIRVFRSTLFMADPPAHTRLRGLSLKGFTPNVIDSWRPIVQNVVDQCLDRVQGDGRMDIARDVAEVIPASVMSEVFGVPLRDRGDFQNWTAAIATFAGGPLRDVENEARLANEGTVKLEKYFQAMIEDRRRKPGNDLMSHFIKGHEEGRLSDEELCAQCVNNMAAGTVTTVHQLGNAINAFLQNPDQLRRLRQQPALARNAVEEVLRYDPAAPFTFKLVKKGFSLGGQQIKKGQLVFLGIAPANRDPEVFERPHEFDITRKDSDKQLAFGSGPHFCLGAGLARLELEMVLETSFRRMPNMGLDEAQPPRLKWESLSFRGFSSLPVVF